MFFLIRFIAIVGVIYYYSPERTRMAVPEGTTLATIESLSGDETVATGRHGASPEAEAGELWRSIPQAARDRLAQEIARQLVEGGLALRPTLPARNESTGVGREDAR